MNVFAIDFLYLLTTYIVRKQICKYRRIVTLIDSFVRVKLMIMYKETLIKIVTDGKLLNMEVDLIRTCVYNIFICVFRLNYLKRYITKLLERFISTVTKLEP